MLSPLTIQLQAKTTEAAPVFSTHNSYREPNTFVGCGIATGLVGDSVLGEERVASISSAIANDVYNRLCRWEGVEPGCL